MCNVLVFIGRSVQSLNRRLHLRLRMSRSRVCRASLVATLSTCCANAGKAHFSRSSTQRLLNSMAVSNPSIVVWMFCMGFRAPSQYPKRRLSVRSRKVSKPRDLYLELSDRSEIWQALRQQCCRCACQISKRYDNLKYQSRGFETLRDLKKRRLFGYWDGAHWVVSTIDSQFLSGLRYVWPREEYDRHTIHRSCLVAYSIASHALYPYLSYMTVPCLVKTGMKWERKIPVQTRVTNWPPGDFNKKMIGNFEFYHDMQISWPNPGSPPIRWPDS